MSECFDKLKQAGIIITFGTFTADMAISNLFLEAQEMCIVFRGKESGLLCGVCKKKITVYEETGRFSDQAPAPPRIDQDPQIAEVNGQLKAICHFCATNDFSGMNLRTLSHPDFKDLRDEMLTAFRNLHRLEGRTARAAVSFSTGLKSQIAKASRELATADS